MPLFAAVIQRLADPVLFLVIAGMAVFGHTTGAFVALLSAFQVLAATFAALGLLDWMTALVAEVGCPDEWCGLTAFLVSFVVVWAVSRVAIGSLVKEDSVRFPPPYDGVAGAVAGAVAGIVLGAAVLLALSMAPLPADFRPDTSKLRLDFGPRMLAIFGSITTSDSDTRAILLDGEPGFEYIPPDDTTGDESTASDERPEGADAVTASGGPDDADVADESDTETNTDDEPPLWGEPFQDSNSNGSFDSDEPFLDSDGNGVYSEKLEENDLNGNGIRDIGLVERYRIGGGRWDRMIVVAPSAADPEDEGEGDESTAEDGDVDADSQ